MYTFQDLDAYYVLGTQNYYFFATYQKKRGSFFNKVLCFAVFETLLPIGKPLKTEISAIRAEILFAAI